MTDNRDQADDGARPTCPATYHGVPCIKRMTQLSDGEWLHGGGHMFATEERMRELDSPDFDARRFLAEARTVPKEEIVNG